MYRHKRDRRTATGISEPLRRRASFRQRNQSTGYGRPNARLRERREVQHAWLHRTGERRQNECGSRTTSALAHLGKEETMPQDADQSAPVPSGQIQNRTSNQTNPSEHHTHVLLDGGWGKAESSLKVCHHRHDSTK